MAMEDREQVSEESGEEQRSEPEVPAAKEAEAASRMDAAKAFFRALHAGGDAIGGDFGMGGAEPATAPAQAATARCPSCERLSQQVRDSDQRATEAENGYKRMAADFENFRKRTEREREEFQAVGIQRVVEALLPAIDDIDRAQSTLTADMSPEKLFESLKLVFNRVSRCLEQVGIKPLTVIGESFDPKYHEPVQEIPTTEFPEGSVIQELRRGYTLNGRVIRPALVNVAAGGEPAPETAARDLQGEEDGSGSGFSEEALTQVGAASEEPEEKEPSKVYDLSEFEGTGDSSDG